MADPFLSVLMPVCNGERYLQPAIESILRQTFGDFEFIVIDDGSTDDTPYILSGCRDPRLKVFRIAHAGLAQALNEGLSRCAGPYIARMDADDICHPTRLALQVEYLESHPEIDVVTCWCDLLNDQGLEVGGKRGGVSDDMILELAVGNEIVHGSIMARRVSLPAAPVYVGPVEDYRLWVRMVRAGRRFGCLPEVLYEFRTHSERYSLTHARSQSAGIVEVQWPLLEECMTTRTLSDTGVRAGLARGWGTVAGAAYRAGYVDRADVARRQFLDLASDAWDERLARAARHGIEAMIWGGCPEWTALGLRWLEWQRRPTAWASYRNLLLTLPPVRKLRSLIRSRT